MFQKEGTSLQGNMCCKWGINRKCLRTFTTLLLFSNVYCIGPHFGQFNAYANCSRKRKNSFLQAWMESYESPKNCKNFLILSATLIDCYQLEEFCWLALEFHMHMHLILQKPWNNSKEAVVPLNASSEHPRTKEFLIYVGHPWGLYPGTHPLLWQGYLRHHRIHHYF